MILQIIIKKILNQISKTNHKRIIVIGHAGTTLGMMQIIANIDTYNEYLFGDYNIKVNNCSICCVQYIDDHFRLITLPNDKHLNKIYI